MGKGYLIVDAKVSDPLAYEDYKRLAAPAMAQYGGRYLVRGGDFAVLEGEARPGRLIVVEFESVAQAKKFYDSPEYRAARAARKESATMNMLVVEGLSQ